MHRRSVTFRMCLGLFLTFACGFVSAAPVPVYQADQVGTYFREWLLCGPFPNTLPGDEDVTDYKHSERCVGFFGDLLESIGGEKNANPKDGEAGWYYFKSDSDLIRLNDIFDPNELVVGYGFCLIESPQDQQAMLSFGCNDGGRVWLNGEMVHEIHLADGRWLEKDDDYVPIQLKKGMNRLLVKIDEGSGDYGFVVRLLEYKQTVSELRKDLETHKHLSVVTLEDELTILFGTPHRIEALAVPGTKVKFEILDKSGRVFRTLFGQPGFLVTLPLQGIPEGDFSVRASFELAEGAAAISEVRHFKGRLPRHNLPERLGADLALRDENGKPYLPIGTYGAPQADYETIHKAGYNFVVGGANDLDAAQAAGLKVGISMHGEGEKWLDSLRETVRANREHPALLFYMLFDEPGYNRADLMLMYDAYNLIHKEDPVHPVYLVITNQRVYGTFGRCCDVLAIDTYPISRGTIEGVGDCILNAYRLSDGDIPVWHCGQLFAWPADRYPTPAEHRMMTYMTVQSGAKGFLWYTFKWGQGSLPDDEPVLWQEHKRIMAELKELEPVIVYPGLGERLGTGNYFLRATAKRGPGGETYVFAVNTSKTETLTSKIQLPTTFTGEIEVWKENRKVRVEDGLLVDQFEPLGVHVYRFR